MADNTENVFLKIRMREEHSPKHGKYAHVDPDSDKCIMLVFSELHDIDTVIDGLLEARHKLEEMKK